MEYFCSKDKGLIESTNSDDDPFGNFSDMMDLDGYSGWTEQLFGYSNNYGYNDQMGFSEPNSFPISDVGNPYWFDRVVSEHSDSHFGVPLRLSDENETSGNQYSISLVPQEGIPRSIGCSFPERMLRALSLFKGSSKGGILAQVWVPIRNEESYVLSTCEQPYLLDQMLLGYREVSRMYTFGVEHKSGSFPGLPGRVFISKIPEWTPDISYYNSAEYSRINDAREHEVHGSIGIPIFSSVDMSCCAVLELVTVKEKPNFDTEMELVSQALKAVDLRTTALPQLLPQHLSPNRGTALAEITDVLRAVCHAHRLPLALTWIPRTLDEDDKLLGTQTTDYHSIPKKKPLLCVEGTACYVNDKEVEGFVLACKEHPLKEGQGVAGKALQSNVPSFSTDVKSYHVNEYPLVQHARKFNLNAAVAIRLRSTYTGNDDYILEFFLPLNMIRTKEQQQLLDSLSGTMQRICRSLRTVTNTELDRFVNPKVEECNGSDSLLSEDASTSSSQLLGSTSELTEFEPMSLDKPNEKKDSIEAGGSSLQASVSRCETEKKRSTAEKTVSLSVLQQYFSGSLKDAAKSIGVCPTTLKRICRQYGISRWPSRKINKVNRSLRKIRTVLDSVEGVEGQLKFDPTTGELVASGQVLQESDSSRRQYLPVKITPTKNSSATTLDKVSTVKSETSSHMTKNLSGCSLSIVSPHKSEEQKSDVTNKFLEQNKLCTSTMIDSSVGSGSLFSTLDNADNQRQPTTKTNQEDGGSIITVKATYKENTTRFKFDPSSGYLHLYEEVASRFKLQVETFQLKYLDDEEEWVMLVSESDLRECLEITEFVGKRSVKLHVRDIPCSIGSSSSSNGFLSGYS